jgi:hypothetical protein
MRLKGFFEDADSRGGMITPNIELNPDPQSNQSSSVSLTAEFGRI